MLKDVQGVLALAYTTNHFQTGLKNILDRAVLAHTETPQHSKIQFRSHRLPTISGLRPYPGRTGRS